MVMCCAITWVSLDNIAYVVVNLTLKTEVSLRSKTFNSWCI